MQPTGAAIDRVRKGARVVSSTWRLSAARRWISPFPRCTRGQPYGRWVLLSTCGEEEAVTAALTGTRRLLPTAAAYGAVLVLAYAADHGLAAGLDRRAFEAVRTRRGPGAVKVARIVSALAEPHIAYPVLALAGISGARQGLWRQAAVPCLVVAGGGGRQTAPVAGDRPPPAASRGVAGRAGRVQPAIEAHHARSPHRRRGGTRYWHPRCPRARRDGARGGGSRHVPGLPGRPLARGCGGGLVVRRRLAAPDRP
jgi:hypothetical protein